MIAEARERATDSSRIGVRPCTHEASPRLADRTAARGRRHARGTLSGYLTAVPNAQARASLLASSGHGYLDYLPLFVGLQAGGRPARVLRRRPLATFHGRAGSRAAQIELVAAVPPLACVGTGVPRAVPARRPCALGAPPVGTVPARTGRAAAARAARGRDRVRADQVAERIGAALASRRRRPATAPLFDQAPQAAISAPLGALPRLRRPRASARPRLARCAAESGRRTERGDMHDHAAVVAGSRCSSPSPPSWWRSVQCRPPPPHAVLLTTEPPNDAVVDETPARVSLRFNETVETAFGALRVYDARARRVDSGRVERPTRRTRSRSACRTVRSRAGPTRSRGGSSRPTRTRSPARSSSTSGNRAPSPRASRRRCSTPGTLGTGRCSFTVGRFLDFALLLLCRRRHARARPRTARRGRPPSPVRAGVAVASAGLAVVAARGDRPARSDGRWIRARRRARPGRRRGCARHALRPGLALGRRPRRALLAVLASCCAAGATDSPLAAVALLVAGALALTPALGRARERERRGGVRRRRRARRGGRRVGRRSRVPRRSRSSGRGAAVVARGPAVPRFSTPGAFCRSPSCSSPGRSTATSR